MAAWQSLIEAHGTRGLDQLLRPAIGFAEEGFPITPRVAYDWRRHQAVLERSPAGRDYYLPGGRAPEYLRYDQHLLAATRHFFEAKKPVCIVCHGVEIAAAAGCLEGRTLTTVAKCALDITQVGGTYVNQPVVVDGNLVSGRVWQDNTPMLKEFIQVLKESVGKR